MKFESLIKIYDPSFDVSSSKIHLASKFENIDPLNLYHRGNFSRWQAEQNSRNFERKFLISLIRIKRDEWLFVGIFEKISIEEIGFPTRYLYNLKEINTFDEISGRVVLKFERSGQMSYLIAENSISKMDILEILREKTTISEFPGYKSVNINRSELKAIVEHRSPSWETALSNVSGVYIVKDIKTHNLYVGIATGSGGIWQRWSEYAKGHGGNEGFKALFQEGGQSRLDDLYFSILEVGDTHTTEAEIRKRETHWIKVLGSRVAGFNGNGPIQR